MSMREYKEVSLYKEINMDFCDTPIVIFAFNRLNTLKRVLANILKCENLHGNGGGRKMYAFVDGPRNDGDIERTAQVRKLLEDFRSYYYSDLELVCRERNFGCEKNIPCGISQVLDIHGRAIVIEDDILVSRYFLNYMDKALELYESNPKIWCINAWRCRFVKLPHDFGHDVYLDNRNMCWGWGTWKDRFAAVDFTMADWKDFIARPGSADAVDAAGFGLRGMIERQYARQLNTWDVQCSYHMIKNGLWAVEPRLAMTKNIGSCGGVHYQSANRDPTEAKIKYWDFNPCLEPEINPDERIVKQFRRAYFNPNIMVRAWRKLKRGLMRFAPDCTDPIPV